MKCIYNKEEVIPTPGVTVNFLAEKDCLLYGRTLVPKVKGIHRKIQT